MTYLFKTDNNLLKAHKEYEKFRQNEKARKLYYDRIIYEMDKNTLIESAKIEGKIEGKIEKSRLTLLKQMKKKFQLTKEDEGLILNCSDELALDNALEEILFADNKDDVLKKLNS